LNNFVEAERIQFPAD